MQVKVNPLFFAFILILIVFGHAVDFAWMLVALICHECAHALMARLRGYVVKKTVLMPYGAMMSMGESFDKTSSVLIGLAGPIINLVFALIVLGVWWLFPAVYPYTISFFYANMSLALFNLLPVYPLDGSRVVLGFCKHKLKAIKGMQIAGIVLSIALFLVFIASFFFGFNLSFGIVAVFLFYGASFGTRDEMYVSVLDAQSKNYSLGVEKKRISIISTTPIVRLYHHISSTSSVVFDIVDEDGNVLSSIDEKQLLKIAVGNKLSTPIFSAIKGGEALPNPETKAKNTQNIAGK